MICVVMVMLRDYSWVFSSHDDGSLRPEIIVEELEHSSRNLKGTLNLVKKRVKAPLCRTQPSDWPPSPPYLTPPPLISPLLPFQVCISALTSFNSTFYH